MSIQDKVTINTHYTRSINLERDASTVEVVQAYIPTSRALRTFARVAESMHRGQAPRAWSWVGPYGSGKSSGSVFLGQLLSSPDSEGAKAALKVLTKADPSIAQAFRKKTEGTDGCLKVLLTGSPEPMGIRLVNALATAAETYWASRKGKNPGVVHELNKLKTQDKLNTSEILNAISILQQALAKTNCAGIVLVIDELGKFLEYEARHYGANDIFLLQAIAEHACKGNDVNIMLFVLLHQSFEQYAKGLGESLKNEWSKVQGRFEEVPFIESSEQVLRVVGAAFQQNLSKQELASLKKIIDANVSVLMEQQGLPASMTKKDAVKLFESCYPLHPVSAILLPLLCQKVAQNERTLFSYLGSHEEFGLQDMLSKLTSVEDFIYPHHVYDYFITNQSSAIGDYMTHRRWAEVVTALERLGEAHENDINLLKMIGILNIVGSKGGFKPSKALLEICLPNRSTFNKSIKVLRDQAIVNFRRYSGEYRVWQGSDFDLELALQEELNNLGKFSLVDKLNEAKAMLPVVARRQTIESGTLRFFLPSFIDAATFKQAKKKSNGPRILFFLATGQDDEELFHSQVKGYYSELDVVALCLSGTQLREAVSETQALRQVGEKKQELNSDPVAKREFEDRLTAAEDAENKLLDALIDDPEDMAWFYNEDKLKITGRRGLQEELSDCLASIYRKAPKISNELINRDKPSAQAVAARNKLLLAMMNNERQSDLGIEKFPPEKAIYRSLLKVTGLHIQPEIGGECMFSAPPQNGRSDKYNLRHVWKVIESFLDSSEKQEKSFVELNSQLMAPPFGVKAGILPILYIAAYMLHRHEVAIFEGRRYRPHFTSEMLERFVKSPDDFTVQRFKIDGMRSSIFDQYAKVIHDDGKKKTILELAQPLASFMGNLPEYTQKTRRGLSKRSESVRSAFNLAKSPEKLLFEEMPKALGYEEILSSEREVVLEGFSADLRNALRELKDAYPQLLDKQRELLARAFNLDPSLDLKELRKIIAGKCHGLETFTVDTKGLRAFIIRLIKDTDSHDEWLEDVLMFLGHKPSKKWLDSDQDVAEYRLNDFSRRVIDLEKLSLYEKGRPGKSNGDFDVYLLRSVKKGSDIFDEVVAVDNQTSKRIEEVVTDLATDLEKLEDKELMLAALAKTVDKFLQEYKKKTTENEVSTKKSLQTGNTYA